MARAGVLAACGAIVLSGAGAGASHARPGDPDPGFGTAGVAQAPFGTGARAVAVALGPAGTVAVAGDVRGSGGEGTLAARFTAAGAPDPTFNGAGFRLDRFGAAATAPQRARAVVVEPGGATVVAGVAGGQIMVARYLPDGSLDGLFGAGGVVLRDLSGGAGMPDGTGLAAVALAPSGQVLVAGSVAVSAGDPYDAGEVGEQVVVGRLSGRGTPDPSFGDAGFAVLQLGARGTRRPARSRAGALALQSDGRVAIAGQASAPDGSTRAVVARLTTAGRLDASFGRGGRTLAQLGIRSAAGQAGSALNALAVGADGSLLAGGAGTDVAGQRHALLARFTAGGTPDGSFGRGGVVRAQVGTGARGSQARALALDAFGIVVAGSDDAGAAFTSRVGSAGRLDCGYGVRGTSSIGAAGSAGADGLHGAFGAVVQPDGKLVVAGRAIGGGVLLGRVMGGAGGVATVARPRLLTLGARHAQRRRGFAYGVVDARCGGSVRVRFRATPLDGRGRTIRTRDVRVSGAYGREVVCAALRGLAPGRRYRIRLESPQRGVASGSSRVLRAVAGERRALAQDGCF